MEPIWRILQPRARNADWTSQHQGGLRSAIAGRQFPQARMRAAGWAEHDPCLMCLNGIVGKEDGSTGISCSSVEPGLSPAKKSIKEEVDATTEQRDKAPKGDLVHRLWRGQCLKELRERHADEQDIRAAADCEVHGRAAWERALLTRPPLPLRRPSPVDTFHWHVRPRDLLAKGHVYLDGSLLDGIAPELARAGWACVVMNDDSEVLAAAYGVPPPWVKGIEGAEAWALRQGVGFTIPAECEYWPDCLPVKIAMGKGPDTVADPRNMLARVHSMLHCAFVTKYRETRWDGCRRT